MGIIFSSPCDDFWDRKKEKAPPFSAGPSFSHAEPGESAGKTATESADMRVNEM
jgi:hypothetical protein